MNKQEVCFLLFAYLKNVYTNKKKTNQRTTISFGKQKNAK